MEGGGVSADVGRKLFWNCLDLNATVPALNSTSCGSQPEAPSVSGRRWTRLCVCGSVSVVVFFCCQVLKWVEETIQVMKVHLLSSNHDSAQENKWDVPFDPSLREVTVSLSGPAPQIELTDPFGR